METSKQQRPYLRPSSVSHRRKVSMKDFSSQDQSPPQPQFLKPRQLAEDEKFNKGFSKKISTKHERNLSMQNDSVRLTPRKCTDRCLKDLSKPALYHNLLSQYKTENNSQKVYLESTNNDSLSRVKGNVNSNNSRLNKSSLAESKRKNVMSSKRDKMNKTNESLEAEQESKDHSDISIDQFLIFVPKQKRSSSVGSSAEKPFCSFQEISKKVSGTYKKIVKDISAYNKVSGERKTCSGIEPARLVKSFLKFNSEQRKNYLDETEKEEEQILSAIAHKRDEEKAKRKKMPPIKVFRMNEMSQDKSYDFEYYQDSNRPNISKWISDFNKRIDREKAANASANDDKIYWHAPMVDNVGWQPESREGHTLTSVGNKLILYGGISTSAIHDIAIFDPERQLWTKPDVNEEMMSIGRHGHSACAFKDRLIIFGGQDNYNPAVKIRQCLNDIKIFNIKTNQFRSVHPSDITIETRRNHAAAIYNGKMLIYGGLNAEGKTLKDIWLLDMERFSWSPFTVYDDRETGIAFHAMCPYFKDKNSKPTTDKKSKPKALLEGIYVFGGKDSKGNILNTLKVLIPTGDRPHWSYPLTHGVPPVPRYGHTMTINPSLDLLVVYGGKNDGLADQFNNVCLLNLEQMKWMPNVRLGMIPDNIQYNHAATMIGSKVIVFGGLGPHEYINENFSFIETDQVEARKLQKLHHTTEDSTLGIRRNRYNDHEDHLFSKTDLKREDYEQIFSSKPLLFNVQHDELISDNVQRRRFKSWLPVPNSDKAKNKMRPRTLISKITSAPSIQAEQ